MLPDWSRSAEEEEEPRLQSWACAWSRKRAVRRRAVMICCCFFIINISDDFMQSINNWLTGYAIRQIFSGGSGYEP